MFVGIDGCPKGWVYAIFDKQRFLFDTVSRFTEMSFLSDSKVALVDIPIGLPESSRRRCDIQARSFLKPTRYNHGAL